MNLKAGPRLVRSAPIAWQVDGSRRLQLTAAAQARHALTVALKAPLLTAFGCDQNPFGGTQARRIKRTQSAFPANIRGELCEAPFCYAAPPAPFTAIAVNCRRRSTAAAGRSSTALPRTIERGAFGCGQLPRRTERVRPGARPHSSAGGIKKDLHERIVQAFPVRVGRGKQAAGINRPFCRGT